MSQQPVWAAVYTADAESNPAAALRPSSPGAISEAAFRGLRLATAELEPLTLERLQEELQGSPLHLAYTGVDEAATGRRTLIVQGPGLDGAALGALLDDLAGAGLAAATLQVLSEETPAVSVPLHGPDAEPVALTQRLQTTAEEHGVDAAITCGCGFEHYGLLIMDMDSTLLAVECIDEIAEHAGVKEQVAAITERAMQGELDFAGSLVERVRMLAGLPKSVLEQVYAERIRPNPGAERLIRTLRGLGIRVAVVSGGFTFFTDRLAGDLGLDATEANELEIVDGELTGEVRGSIVDGARKAEFLGELLERYDLGAERAIAMGDGANDLPMIESAGLGIAYHAKPKVRDAAPYNLASGQLDGVLYLLGLTDEQIAYYSEGL